MTGRAWLLLILAAACAGADWNAVARGQRRWVHVFKPATMVALIGVALALRPHSEIQRELFVAALVFGLTGDVFLMLPRERFLAGLMAFFGGHMAYLAGFLLAAGAGSQLAVAAAPTALLGAAVLGQVVGRLVRQRPALALAVLVYGLALAAMAVAAISFGRPAAAVGGILFLVSDSLLAWNRFVRPLAWGPPAVIVTYHLAQAALVLSLAP